MSNQTLTVIMTEVEAYKRNLEEVQTRGRHATEDTVPINPDEINKRLLNIVIGLGTTNPGDLFPSTSYNTTDEVALVGLARLRELVVAYDPLYTESWKTTISQLVEMKRNIVRARGFSPDEVEAVISVFNDLV